MASLAAPRSITALFVLLALLAITLGAVGVYGGLAHAVAERAHEIGVRIALGAGRADIFCDAVGRGLLLALPGIALGLSAVTVTFLPAGFPRAAPPAWTRWLLCVTSECHSLLFTLPLSA